MRPRCGSIAAVLFVLVGIALAGGAKFTHLSVSHGLFASADVEGSSVGCAHGCCGVRPSAAGDSRDRRGESDPDEDPSDSPRCSLCDLIATLLAPDSAEGEHLPPVTGSAALAVPAESRVLPAMRDRPLAPRPPPAT